MFALADRHDFTVLADECYADIYFDAPLDCSLPARLAQSERFHPPADFSLSVQTFRLAGTALRHRGGLMPTLIAKDSRPFAMWRGRRYPRPILAASAAAWRDENHVATNRALYRQKMAAAEQILGNRMKRPDGGFFVWLKVGNGEDFALRLWREQGVRVLPGAYMGREIEPGKIQSNPGFSYVRVALVSDLSTIMTALERVREIFWTGRTLAAGQSQNGDPAGVYHPRAKGGAMSDALADARRALARLAREAMLRGAGLLLIAAALAVLAAVISFNSADASFDNANGRAVSNLMGPMGAIAADLLLQNFGFAALTALAPLFVWGARALAGRTLKYAMWRAVAWPLGHAALMVAAGLGIFPAPASLPAGAGGLIGIAARGPFAHAAQDVARALGRDRAAAVVAAGGIAAVVPRHRPALHADRARHRQPAGDRCGWAAC